MKSVGILAADMDQAIMHGARGCNSDAKVEWTKFSRVHLIKEEEPRVDVQHMSVAG